MKWVREIMSMKNIGRCVSVAVIVSIVSLSALIGCNNATEPEQTDEKNGKEATTKPKIVCTSTQEYWINPDLSAKVRVSGNSLLSTPKEEREFRLGIKSFVTKYSGLDAWSDMDIKIKNGQGVFTATAWTPDLRKVKPDFFQLDHSLNGDGELVLSVPATGQNGLPQPRRNSSASERSDKEIEQLVEYFRVTIKNREKSEWIKIRERMGWRRIIHGPGKLVKTKNFRQESNEAMWVEGSRYETMRVLHEVFLNNDGIAKTLVRQDNGPGIYNIQADAMRDPEIRDIILTKIWGHPGTPELTYTDIANAKPLFDYATEVKAAKAVSLQDQLAGIGVIKQSFPPTTQPAGLQYDKDKSCFLIYDNKRTGQQHISLSIGVISNQGLTGSHHLAFHRVTDGDGRVVFPKMGVHTPLSYCSSGSYSRTNNVWSYTLDGSLIGNFEPRPTSLDIMGELYYTTGVKRKIAVVFPSIEKGAESDKPYKARITDIQPVGDMRLVYVTLNLPKDLRFCYVKRFESADGREIRGGDSTSLQRSGPVKFVLNVLKKEDVPRIKTIRVYVYENYKDHVIPVQWKNIPFQKWPPDPK